MSLETALTSTVSALRSQGTAIAAVSQNIANSSTTAYKIEAVNFQALVNDAEDGSGGGGGVIAQTVQDIDQTGQIATTGVSTNVAIQGQGFFVVSDNLDNKPAAYDYTRNGNFNTDATGNLINDQGEYLLGQPTNSAGVVTSTNPNDLNSLTPINLNAIQGAASATTEVDEKLNLPADAPVGASFTTSFEVVDALGVSSTVDQTFTKTNANSWTMTLSQPTLTSDPTVQSGTLAAPTGYTLTFNGDGSLASPTTTPALAVDFTAPAATATGANPAAVTLNIGTPGLTDGITQYSSNTATPSLTVSSITDNGVRFGKLSSVEIDSTGLVTAVFDNGLRQPVYQIPIATFPNPDGLTQVSGGIYDENQNAGVLSLQNPNVGNAGALVPEALESSATDISEEFNKLIVAQQAYSAATQIITTVRTLDQTLDQAIQ